MRHVNAVITYHSLVEAAPPAADEPRGPAVNDRLSAFRLKANEQRSLSHTAYA